MWPRDRVLQIPTSEQIRRGSGFPHDVREHQGLQPCGVGQDFAYHASAMKLEWTQAPPKHGHICNLSRSAHQRKDASAWLNFSQLSDGPTRPPTLDEAAVLTWLACGDGTNAPIGPLSGVARHPCNVPADMKQRARGHEGHLVLLQRDRLSIGPRENHTDQIQINALQVLEDAATPEDFVVMKVDIDSSDIEISLVWEILRSPKLSSLVDEIFFEYHFNVSPDFGWEDSGENHTVDDALHLLRELRAVGIRSHFWL